MTVTRSDVVREARKWIGTRFKHQGRGSDGLDCVGLVARVASDLGLSDRDYTGYRREAHRAELIDKFKECGMISVSLRTAGDGDVVFFAASALPFHVGILSTFNEREGVIHARADWRKVVEQYLASVDYRAVCAFRFPGVING